MALKDILVYVDRSRGALTRLRLAGDLACRHRAHLTALYVRQLTPAQEHTRQTAELGMASADELGRLERQFEASMDDDARPLQAVLDRLGREHGLATDWRTVSGHAAQLLAQHARYADLCILGSDSPGAAVSIDYSFSEQMLFVTGRPVLLVPDSWSDQTLGRHLVVAWNSSRPAARAVNDALPLIELAERTSIIMANPKDFIEGHDALPAEQLLAHLRRHGANVDAVTIQDLPADSIAAAIQDKSRTLGADLLIAGAFGHARLWEKLLGGVTRDLLEGMRMPMMMSH